MTNDLIQLDCITIVINLFYRKEILISMSIIVRQNQMHKIFWNATMKYTNFLKYVPTIPIILLMSLQRVFN